MHVDALRCPKCQTAMVVLAFITDLRIVKKILDYLKLPTSPPPLAPARLPPEHDLFGDHYDQDAADEASLGHGSPSGTDRSEHALAASDPKSLRAARGPSRKF